MITEEHKKMIEENAMALATVGRDGKPHVIAVAFVKVKDGKIVVTDNYIVETTKNIQDNKNIALAVWNREWQEDCRGFEFSGTAEYHMGDEWHDFVKSLPENEGEACKGAIVVTVEKVKKLA
ncbi:MAG: pyridoxamine 5'-phosphate oxidase family protein [Candidatus Aenigmarchaeota archaeon]